MKRTVKGAFMGFGGQTTSVEVDQPAVDPAVEHAAKLKSSFARIQAENAAKKQAAEQSQARIDAVYQKCDGTTWTAIEGMLADQSLVYHTMPQADAVELAYKTLTE